MTARSNKKEGVITAVATNKSIFDETALAAALQMLYGLSPQTRAQLYRISGSDVYRVMDGDAVWFLKVYRATGWDARRARTSAMVLDMLDRHRFSVPPPQRSRDGEILVSLPAPEGERLAYMVPEVIGPEPQADNPQQGELYGRTAARLHQLMDELEPPAPLFTIDFDYLFGRYLRGVEQYLGDEKDSLRFLHRLARALWEALEQALPRTGPQYGFCHGDLHCGNAVLNGDNELFLLDFDASGAGWRVLDIGTYMVSADWMGLDEESRRRRRTVCDHFLRGYNQIRPVSETERKTLALFMAIRHFELFGIGMGRVPYTGSHWVNGAGLQRDVAWFREWLAGNPELGLGYLLDEG